MERIKSFFRTSLFMILVVSILITTVGCNGETTVSGPQVNYGDEEDIDFGDDGDSVVINKETVGSGTGDPFAGETDPDFNYNATIDEEGKKGFLDSVPDSLRGQTVTIMIWWPTLEFEKRKMEHFSEETGIKIKWLYVDSGNYMQQLSALKLQGNSPDIACVMSNSFPYAIMQDYFKPLSDGKMNLNQSIYDKDSMQMFAWEGKQYGVIVKGTSHINMGFLMYNADMFEKYGVTDPNTLWKSGTWNWDTFVRTSQDIQTKSGVTALTGEYHFYRLAQTCGEDATAFKNGKLENNTGSTNYRNAYKWLCDLTGTGQYKIADAGINRAGFMSGKSAMMVEDTWALQAGERYEDCSFKIGYVPLPCQTTTTIVPSDAQLWGFPVGSKHTEAASYALEYWMNPAYDESDAKVWINDSAASFINWLWEQPKTFKVCEGIIEYGGDYKWSSYQRDLLGLKNNVDSTMDRWSSVIEANLKKIYS